MSFRDAYFVVYNEEMLEKQLRIWFELKNFKHIVFTAYAVNFFAILC